MFRERAALAERGSAWSLPSLLNCPGPGPSSFPQPSLRCVNSLKGCYQYPARASQMMTPEDVDLGAEKAF